MHMRSNIYTVFFRGLVKNDRLSLSRKREKNRNSIKNDAQSEKEKCWYFFN